MTLTNPHPPPGLQRIVPAPGRVVTPPDLLAGRAAALDRLGLATQLEVLLQMPPSRAGALLSHFSDRTARDVLGVLSSSHIGELLAALPLDAVTRLVAVVDASRRPAVLAKLPPRRAAWVRLAMYYPPDSIARLVSDAFVQASPTTTASDALASLQQTGLIALASPDLFVVDDAERLIGVVSLQQLLEAHPDVPVGDLAQAVGEAWVGLETERDDLVRLTAHGAPTAVPALRETGTLLGVVRLDGALATLAPGSLRRRAWVASSRRAALIGRLTALALLALLFAGMGACASAII